MIREYYIKEFIWKLKGGASDDELLAIFFQREMEYITRPYYDVNTDESFTQRTPMSLLQHDSSKASIIWCSAFFIVQLSYPYMATGKTTSQ